MSISGMSVAVSRGEAKGYFGGLHKGISQNY